MAGKRGATSDLNHDNWDRDEEPEDSGTFQKASDDALKTRVIKTARRRNPISSVRDGSGEGEKKSAFTGFGGFGKAPAPAASSAFSFLSNLTAPKTPPKVNGIENKSDKSDIATFKFNSNPVTSASTATDSTKASETKLSWTQSDKISTSIFPQKTNAKNNPPTNGPPEESNIYYSKLKGLNQSVSTWIKKHVDTNPFINLQPVFKDYEKHFNELEKEKNLKPSPDTSKPENNKNVAVSSMGSFQFKPTTNIPDSTTEKTQPDSKKAGAGSQEKPATIPKFSFGSSVTSSGNSPTTAPFSFGDKPGPGLFSFGSPATAGPATAGEATKTPPSKPSFSFGLPTTTPSTIPSFPSSKPFTFANVAKPASEEQNQDAEDDEEPPKNEFTPIVEKDHVFTTRCKVFVKKDEKFGDRGVGNLFLKPIQDSEKVQLIVRADTNLGNLLLNFILNDSIPLKRLGKKDVMLVCIPTSDSKPPPVPVLLRVKNAEEADELLQILEKHKK